MLFQPDSVSSASEVKEIEDAGPAKAMGLTFPQSFLLQVDRVIE